jgi:hypothetical protein
MTRLALGHSKKRNGPNEDSTPSTRVMSLTDLITNISQIYMSMCVNLIQCLLICGCMHASQRWLVFLVSIHDHSSSGSKEVVTKYPASLARRPLQVGELSRACDGGTALRQQHGLAGPFGAGGSQRACHAHDAIMGAGCCCE